MNNSLLFGVGVNISGPCFAPSGRRISRRWSRSASSRTLSTGPSCSFSTQTLLTFHRRMPLVRTHTHTVVIYCFLICLVSQGVFSLLDIHTPSLCVGCRPAGPGHLLLWKPPEASVSADHQERNHCGQRLHPAVCCHTIWRGGTICWTPQYWKGPSSTRTITMIITVVSKNLSSWSRSNCMTTTVATTLWSISEQHVNNLGTFF